jgi:hypothetical protein
MKRKSEKDKKLVDDARLMRSWRAWHREQLEGALTGVHGNVMERLIAQLKDLRAARELVAFIEAQDWSAVDVNTQLIALHEINAAITQLRERAGQEPIDDALPGEPLRAFQVIRNIMHQFPAQAGRPRPGTGVIRASEEEVSDEQ